MLAPFARCQIKSVSEQLNLGIRFFDFLLDLSSDEIRFCHGITTCPENFEDEMKTIFAWTNDHPKELIVLSFRCDKIRK